MSRRTSVVCRKRTPHLLYYLHLLTYQPVSMSKSIATTLFSQACQTWGVYSQWWMACSLSFSEELWYRSCLVSGLFTASNDAECSQLIQSVGSKPISPLGAIGLIARKKLRAAIHKQYPRLRDEVENGGMASFIRDVALEVDVIEEDAEEKVVHHASDDYGLVQRRQTM